MYPKFHNLKHVTETIGAMQEQPARQGKTQPSIMKITETLKRRNMGNSNPPEENNLPETMPGPEANLY